MEVFVFIFNSALLGVGLAMDAFSVSLADGLHEPHMRRGKMCAIAGLFAFFQALMPLIGWICIHTVVQYFQSFEKWIPWIALALLSYIGSKMLFEGIHSKGESADAAVTGPGALLAQGIATSIDALSVGFAIAEHSLPTALAEVLIIAAVTFVICFVGLTVGKTAGTRLSDRAGIFGGIILIVIGLEIFISSFF